MAAYPRLAPEAVTMSGSAAKQCEEVLRLERILLADDHQVLLEGMRKLLEPEFSIAGTAADGRELVEKAITLRPDVAVLDIGLPLLNGIEAARQIGEKAPGVKIVVLTQQTDQAYVREAFRAGARGYVVKQAAASELQRALRAAVKGEYYVSPSLLSGDIQARLDPKVNPSELFGGVLTPRQREVLQLVAEGKAGKEIAALLKISPKTVEFHKACIMDQLGMKSTAELTRYAIQHGLI